MPDSTFYFYDLETTGTNPFHDRIVQFAGQRTTLDLQPIDAPHNILVKLHDDVLVHPGAALTTGLSPQMTAGGITELELSRILMSEVFKPGTIALGFNSISFDDEFIRHLLWRTLHEPYTREYADGRGRWDLLDLVRMTRALRPDSITWPFGEDNRPSNTLELLARANHLDHEQAHDALSDIRASIGLAQLLKSHQPKLFDYLFSMRDKASVVRLINPAEGRPFVYTQGGYSKDYQHTSVVVAIREITQQNETLVYDLRIDPKSLNNLSDEEVYTALFGSKSERESLPRIPVTKLRTNRCPAIAPLGTIDAAGWQRIWLDAETVERHLKTLKESPGLVSSIIAAYAARPEYAGSDDPAEQLYAGFIDKPDAQRLAKARTLNSQALAGYHPFFDDPRLPGLLVQYKARYFPESLSYDEQIAWGNYRKERLEADLVWFEKEMSLEKSKATLETQQHILAELRAWADAILPSMIKQETLF